MFRDEDGRSAKTCSVQFYSVSSQLNFQIWISNAYDAPDDDDYEQVMIGS